MTFHGSASHAQRKTYTHTIGTDIGWAGLLTDLLVQLARWRKSLMTPQGTPIVDEERLKATPLDPTQDGQACRQAFWVGVLDKQKV